MTGTPRARGRGRVLAALRARLGGPARTRAIILFACVLGLETADLASLGAIAGQLKPALHLHNTELGVLAAAPALASALATIPVGILADRTPRAPLLAASTAVWALATVAAGASASFGMLLVVRLLLGAATAAAAPLVASLVGDLFESGERGVVWGYILAGQLLGSAFGLLVIGNVAALSWRAGLWVLAVPSVALTIAIQRLLPEPARGRAARLHPGASEIRETGVGTAAAERSGAGTAADRPGPGADGGKPPAGGPEPELAAVAEHTDAEPRSGLVLDRDPAAMTIRGAVIYVLRIPTNVMLIVSSSLGYFFQAGINTFGVVFVIAHFGVPQSVATSLLALIAIGALAGVVLGGRLADGLLARGRLSARVVVGGAGFVVSAAIFVPGLLSRDLAVAMLLYFFAAAALAAPSAPLDAARLDVVPGRLWGRAEAVRTVLRSLSVAAAPLVFGVVSDSLSSGRRATTKGLGYHASGAGLKYTFLLMLIPMAAGGLLLVRGARAYRRDVVTALASQENIERRRGGSAAHQRPRDDGSSRPFTASPQPS